MKAVQDVIPIESELNARDNDDDIDLYEESPVIQLQANGRPSQPRRVTEMQDFGSQLAKEVDADDGLLFGDDLVNSRDPAFSRQNDDGDDEDVTEDPTGNDVTGP